MTAYQVNVDMSSCEHTNCYFNVTLFSDSVALSYCCIFTRNRAATVSLYPIATVKEVSKGDEEKVRILEERGKHLCSPVCHLRFPLLAVSE